MAQKSTSPILLHALLDRRAFIARAAAAAAGVAGAGGLLAACTSDGGTAAPGTSSTVAGPGPGASPLLYDRALPYWMQGGFAPVATETEAVDLSITGSLPPELAGLYVRNGSNPAGAASPHWFLGDGMVHGVRLERGQARWYRNKYVGTPLYHERKGVLDPGPGAPGKERNQSNVSVFHHGGRLLTSGEVGLPYELSLDDLSTKGPFDYAGRLTTAMTAHPKIDPATGRLHFFGYGFTAPFLTYHVVEPDGTLVSSQEIAVGASTMIHDFAITDRDVVFWELPVLFDLQAAIAIVSGGPGVAERFPYAWKPEYGARIGIMPLGGPASAIRWVEIDPCYVFHGVNAHRDGDDVVIDVCRMPSVFVPGQDGLGPTAVHRWRVNTAGPALTFRDERLTDREMDLPTIDRRRTGLRHDSAFFVLVDDLPDHPVEFAGLARMDTRTGELDRYEPGLGYRLNEATFVPRGTGHADGWLLSYAWDRARNASDLVVLDAADLAAGPVARVHLPVRVPYGFHGAWVPQG